MRVKFRAWDTKRKVMFQPFEGFIDATTGEPQELVGQYWDDGLLPDKNLILMQFTGLLDKSGKEIYEGDILRLLNTVDGSCGGQRLFPHFIGEVFWHEQDCRFLVKAVPWKVPEDELPTGTMQPDNVGTFCRGTVGSWVCVFKEVIGNIYESNLEELQGG